VIPALEVVAIVLITVVFAYAIGYQRGWDAREARIPPDPNTWPTPETETLA